MFMLLLELALLMYMPPCLWFIRMERCWRGCDVRGRGVLLAGMMIEEEERGQATTLDRNEVLVPEGILMTR